eukprot:GHVS01043878.1.p1 GENE.GHVS01043878.1~~GHVS01043878.1.p1  ORF type:complete len:248 (-),score=47.56 GHVS01043878.1:140-883(-)
MCDNIGSSANSGMYNSGMCDNIGSSANSGMYNSGMCDNIGSSANSGMCNSVMCDNIGSSANSGMCDVLCDSTVRPSTAPMKDSTPHSPSCATDSVSHYLFVPLITGLPHAAVPVADVPAAGMFTQAFHNIHNSNIHNSSLLNISSVRDPLTLGTVGSCPGCVQTHTRDSSRDTTDTMSGLSGDICVVGALFGRMPVYVGMGFARGAVRADCAKAITVSGLVVDVEPRQALELLARAVPLGRDVGQHL